ncbi:hypothetical protein Patl1_17907 [Pistacia atlantica]|uniref:Uncharacterized protein n=1 Tax=Pistacia atlantica TaxID=434234 RepID=A0ACC1C428_9ROSI|nr:hypothetical protein Patl1_17907 [Pistacia atlantica]
MVFDPINHTASITSSMQVESQLLSNQNLVSNYSRNHLCQTLLPWYEDEHAPL